MTRMIIEIRAFIATVDNYRGFCVGAISQADYDGYRKTELVEALPAYVSYSEYVGVIGILNGEDDGYRAVDQLEAAFRYER